MTVITEAAQQICVLVDGLVGPSNSEEKETSTWLHSPKRSGRLSSGAHCCSAPPVSHRLTAHRVSRVSRDWVPSAAPVGWLPPVVAAPRLVLPATRVVRARLICSAAADRSLTLVTGDVIASVPRNRYSAGRLA